MAAAKEHRTGQTQKMAQLWRPGAILDLEEYQIKPDRDGTLKKYQLNTAEGGEDNLKLDWQGTGLLETGQCLGAAGGFLSM